MTDTEPLRFQRQERAEVLACAALAPIAMAFWGALETAGRSGKVTEFAVLAGFGLGLLVSVWVLFRTYEITLTPDRRVVFRAILRSRSVPFDEVRRVEETVDEWLRVKIVFKFTDGGEVILPDVEQYRMAAKYLKERLPALSLALRHEVVYKSLMINRARQAEQADEAAVIPVAAGKEEPAAAAGEPEDLGRIETPLPPDAELETAYREVAIKAGHGVTFRLHERSLVVGKAVIFPCAFAFLGFILLLQASPVASLAAALVGAAFGSIFSSIAMNAIYEVTMTDDRRVILTTFHENRIVPFGDVACIDEADPGRPGSALVFRLKDGEEIQLSYCPGFRVAAMYLKRHAPDLDYRLSYQAAIDKDEPDS